MDDFVCPKCGNTNPLYIGYLNGLPYCRYCILFKGEKVTKEFCSNASPALKLNYCLSKDQKDISNRVIYNYKRGYDTLIYAVCGAGKTELVYGVIEYALKRKQQVGFALPRRDVVIELYPRLVEAFPNMKITAVYGGHTSTLLGDIIILTTHQLYRYDHYFDLIILDEIDAFPYNGNILLNTFFKKALRGNSVLMSATPSQEVQSYYQSGNREMLELNVRFHKHPLPVPQFVIRLGFLKNIYIIKKLKKYISENKPAFVFAPTIEMANELYRSIKIFVRDGNVVHSKVENRSKIINLFREGKYKYLVTTAVLERGVTVKNLQVIIFNSDHNLYDEYALIQISGRVGRKKDAPDGEVIFLCSKVSEAMENARKTIIDKNRYL